MNTIMKVFKYEETVKHFAVEMYDEDGELYLHLENKDFIKKHNVKVESITVHKHYDWGTL